MLGVPQVKKKKEGWEYKERKENVGLVKEQCLSASVRSLPAFSPAISQRDPQVALFSSTGRVQELDGVSGEKRNHDGLGQVDSS